MVFTGLAGGSHFNPNEARDARGRWTSGDDDSYTPTRGTPGMGWGDNHRIRHINDNSPFGRAKSIVGYASRDLNDSRRFPRPDRATVERYLRLFKTWAAAGDLDDKTFRDRYLGYYTSADRVLHLRAAAEAFAHGQSYGDMANAGWHLAAAVLGRNPSPNAYAPPNVFGEWSGKLDSMENMAATASPSPIINANATAPAAGKAGADQTKTPTAKDEADALGEDIRDRADGDDFMAYAFPTILFAEGGDEGYPPAGITLTAYKDMKTSSAISEDDRAAIRSSPPNQATLVAYYRAFLDHTMREVVSRGGYEQLEQITDFRARLAFVDALFARGESQGAALIRLAIRKTLEQFKMTPWDNRETGVLKQGTFIKYRDLANDASIRDKLIENLDNLLGGLGAFEGRERNIKDYLERRS